MEQKGLRTGHFLALAGAVAAFGSLWRPWYSMTLPPQLRELLGGGGRLGQDPGLLGQMARGLAAALPSELSASGWRELEGADVAFAVGALAVVALVLGAAGALGGAVRVDPGAAGRLIAVVGAAGALIAVVHLVHRPGGAAAADYLHVADGLWLALGGSVAVVAGGLWAAVDSRGAGAGAGARRAGGAAPSLAAAFPPLVPDLPPVFAEAPGAAHGSVAPPGA
jgi:hypothetical protein